MRFYGVVLCLFVYGCSALLFHDFRPTRPRYGRHPPVRISPQQLGEFQSLNFTDTTTRKVILLNFVSRDPVAFHEAWDMQKSMLSAQLERISSQATDQFADKRAQTEGTDTVILLQHHPVYTLGTSSDENFITSSDNHVPVVRMDRGGEVTYHGPGQLTVYPILDLRGYKQDIHWYIRALEEATIRALARFGIWAVRQDGITGVWVDDVKVAAVGIKCRKWVTMHGFAINVDENSLGNFGGIVACGLENRSVGCVNQFLKEEVTVEEVADAVVLALEEVLQIEFL
jgi:lipoyl(octanoyl) transferase